MTDRMTDVREILGKVPELKDQLEAMDSVHPLSGSLLWEDRLAGWGGSLPVHFASSKLAMAADHLFAWHCLSITILPVYAHLTLLRPALEASVQARWLLDPTVDTRVRVARAVGVRTYDLGMVDLVERETAAERARHRATPSTDDGKSAAEAIRLIRAEANAAGIVEIPMLDTVSLLTKYPRQQGGVDVLIWRYASGVVHCLPWTGHMSDREIVSAGATMATRKEEANPKTSAAIARIAVRHLDRAIQDLGHYLEPGSRD